MSGRSEKYNSVLLIIILVLLACVCRIAGQYSVSYAAPLMYCRSLLYVLAVSVWTFSVFRRVICAKTRRYLTASAALMILWIAARIFRYLLWGSSGISRWLQYIGCVPILGLPLLAVFVVNSVFQGEDLPLPRHLKILFIPAAILFLLVVTNDFHHLLFVFYQGSFDARQGPVFYLLIYWMLFCLSLTAGFVIKGNPIVRKRWRGFLPAVSLCLITIYTIFYILEMYWLDDYIILFCLCILIFYESLIRLNLLKNNARYRELFRCIALPAVIVDSDYNEKIRTDSYSDVPQDIMRQAAEGPILSEDGIRLFSASIRNGRILWKEGNADLPVSDQQKKMQFPAVEERGERKEAADLSLTADRELLAERIRLNAQLRAQIHGKKEVLTKLLEAFERAEDPETEHCLLRRISFTGTALKYGADLDLLLADKSNVSPCELKSLIERACFGLTELGVVTGRDFNFKKAVSLRSVFDLNEVFEEIVEYSLDTLSELFFTVTEAAGGILMSLHLCTQADFSGFSMDGLRIRHEGDGKWLLDYFAGKGGSEP